MGGGNVLSGADFPAIEVYLLETSLSQPKKVDVSKTSAVKVKRKR